MYTTLKLLIKDLVSVVGPGASYPLRNRATTYSRIYVCTYGLLTWLYGQFTRAVPDLVRSASAAPHPLLNDESTVCIAETAW